MAGICFGFPDGGWIKDFTGYVSWRVAHEKTPGSVSEGETCEVAF